MARHLFVEGQRGALPDEICRSLRCARLRQGFTKRELAERLGCSIFYVSALEGVQAQRRRPSVKMAETLIDVLDLGDDPVLCRELRLLSAPAAGRSKVGFYVRSKAEKAALAREARARQRAAARERAADSVDLSGNLGRGV